VSGFFFHDLQCRSGLGDRLLDVWAARTLTRLYDPNRLLMVRWYRGLRFASFVGDYNTDAFSVTGCAFVDTPPAGALSLSSQFSHVALNDRGLLPLPGDGWQIVLRAGMIWGNSPPERLHADRVFYSLDPSIPLEYVVATYRDVASHTLPAASIRAAAPPGIDGCVGLHVRLGDKLVPRETAVDMAEPTWRDLERQTLAYLDTCIAQRRPIFLCSDDLVYRTALIDHLRARGAVVVTSDPALAPGELAGSAALADFFALCRCTLIVQMTKYSTFSLAAALAGRIPLVNFFQDKTGVGHRLDIWRSVLAR
jgi:hypothetical protein